MRARPRVLISVVVTILLAGCGGPSHQKPRAPGDLLVLSGGSSVAAIHSGNGALLFEGPAVAAANDPGRLFRTTFAHGTTTLSLVSAASGKAAAAVRLMGDLRIQTVAGDGDLVALMPAAQHSPQAFQAIARPVSDIVVADPREYYDERRFHLEGNYEPEAFSVDGSSLFLINYLPATAPRAYRVIGLDLDSGETYRLGGRDKTDLAPERMAGERLQQVPSSDGAMLFTLYTTQPSAYAKGYDWSQAGAKGPVAFVHALSLEGGWAVCVGLPKELWGGESADEAMAYAPTRHELFVADAERGVVTVMDSSELEVTRTETVDFGGEAGQVRAALDPEERSLFVSVGSHVFQVDPDTLDIEVRWNLPGAVSALGFDGAGTKLFAALPGALATVNPATGRVIETVRAPRLAGARAVSAVSS